MIFAFGFVIGIGFTITALLTLMLYAAAQADQALGLEFAPAWQETQAARIDGPQDVGRGKMADAAALAAAPNR
jgi:uncharacterized membrane-anchored protein